MLHRASTMIGKSSQPQGRAAGLSQLCMMVERMHLSKELSNIPPLKDVYFTTATLLTTIRVSCSAPGRCTRLTNSQDSMVHDPDYVELGRYCAQICMALERRTDKIGLDDLNNAVRDAMGELTL